MKPSNPKNCCFAYNLGTYLSWLWHCLLFTANNQINFPVYFDYNSKWCRLNNKHSLTTYVTFLTKTTRTLFVAAAAATTAIEIFCSDAETFVPNFATRNRLQMWIVSDDRWMSNNFSRIVVKKREQRPSSTKKIPRCTYYTAAFIATTSVALVSRLFFISTTDWDLLLLTTPWKQW